MIFEKVKYKLIDHDRDRVLGNDENGNFVGIKTDPINWDESEKTLKRSKKTFGVWTELSKNLEFTEDSADFLRIAYLNRDIEARVSLEEWRAFEDEDGFYLHFTGTFDFSEYKSEENIVKIPFKTGGLAALIESQLTEKFELNRLESINGKIIDPLSLRTVALTSREILLISQLETLEEQSEDFPQGNPTQIPNLILVSNSDEPNMRQVVLGENRFVFTTVRSDESEYFYLKSDLSKTINLRVDYDIYVSAGGASSFRFRLYVMRYSLDGANFNHEQTYTLVNPAGDFTSERTFAGEINLDIDLEVDDSLLFLVEILTNIAGTTVYTEQYTYNKLGIYITEESIREDSQAETVLIHDAGEKLMQIITGEKGRFYSEFYGRKDIPNTNYTNDGEFSYTGLTLGFWIRKFIEENLEFSLDQLIKTTNSVHNTGYTIETHTGKEIFVMEDLKYFFQNGIAIRLPEQVSNVERKAAKEMHYANMTFGYKQPSGDNLYEEAMGLDEYNTQTSYTNPITRVDNKYDKVSEARADSYGIEFARRKPIENFPQEDTRYDKSVFILDLKKGIGDNLEQRLWGDDFEQAPLGVFSPNTATNLRLTPFRNSERHQWFYGSGLVKFQSDKVRYSNSIGNSSLITKKEGEVERAENGDILISDIERSMFENQWITFEHPVDFNINNQIYGTTEVGGRNIPNYFFKVEFINEHGVKEYGYLFELKPNNKGKWKLLKAI